MICGIGGCACVWGGVIEMDKVEGLETGERKREIIIGMAGAAGREGTGRVLNHYAYPPFPHALSIKRVKKNQPMRILNLQYRQTWHPHSPP